MRYHLAGGAGFPLPNLKGSMALYRAGDRDLRVLICLAQLSSDEGPDNIALYCECTVDEVFESIKYWQKYGIVLQNTEEDKNTKAEEVLCKSEDIGAVMSLCAEVIGKADVNFSQSEIESVKDMIAKYDIEFLLSIIKYYCGERNKNLNYAEKAADAMLDKGICTAAGFSAYIEGKDSICSEARRLFGTGNTAFSERQRNLIDKWSIEYGYGKEEFIMAYDIMADNATRRSFPYIDKIMKKWHDNRLNNAEEIRKFMEKESEEKEKATPAPQKQKQKQKPKLKNDTFDVKDAFAKALEGSAKLFNGEDKDV